MMYGKGTYNNTIETLDLINTQIPLNKDSYELRPQLVDCFDGLPMNVNQMPSAPCL